MDNATWAALTLTLTALGGVWTWLTFQRRGVSSGLRVLAFALLPLAAYLTKTLQMFTEIAGAITSWAGGLVFSPRVWIGIVVAGISVGLFLLSGALTARGIGTRGRPAAAPGPRQRPRAVEDGTTEGSKQGKGAPAIDDDLADIEALLRKRGIS